ncbi:MAG: cell division protein SepF [Bifidobacteriaceae bacterium]|jgi:cell division inhibitor SepF|nr:cell division protein SepF [Bifidobacteriaceae bacterium]
MAGWMQNTGRRLGLLPSDSDDYYYDEPEEQIADVTPIHAPHGRSHLTVAEPMQRIVTSRPRNFEDAKIVGTTYREQVPVIIDLSEASDADARRLIDFAMGLTHALRGNLERITRDVFLLSPPNLDVSEVTAEPHRRYDSE